MNLPACCLVCGEEANDGAAPDPPLTLACSVGVAECHGRARGIDLASLLSGGPPPGTVQVRQNCHAVLSLPPRGGGRPGCFGEGREPVKRRPEPVGRGRPGGTEALLVGQLSPVVGAGDPGARWACRLEFPAPQV